jgi:hypothetical protein
MFFIQRSGFDDSRAPSRANKSQNLSEMIQEPGTQHLLTALPRVVMVAKLIATAACEQFLDQLKAFMYTFRRTS